MSDTTSAILGGQGGAAPAASTETAVAAPAAASAAPAAAAPAAGSAPAVGWLGQTDELTTGYVQNKGWQSAGDAVKSYQNLEKLLGADRAGNTFVLPKENATPEELSAHYNRLGRPVDASGYKIDVPEGSNADFAKLASGKFHELGLSQKQGESLAAWWNESAGAGAAATAAAKVQQFQADDQTLRQDWGQAFAQNLSHAQNAARGLGLDEGTINKMADALGHKGTMQLLQKIGSGMGEATFVSGDSDRSFGNAMTPAQAKSEIKRLTQDKSFIARYTSRDSAALAEMSRLHGFAHPAD